jgi:tetratricopeptide (TPR) repeat protein
MRESARRAAELETGPGSPWSTLARAAYGFSLYLSGDLQSAEVALEEAVRSEWPATFLGILAYSTLSLIAVEGGGIARADDLARTARSLAIQGGMNEVPQGSLAHTATGAVRAAQGRAGEARAEFEHAIRTRRNTPG